VIRRSALPLALALALAAAPASAQQGTFSNSADAAIRPLPAALRPAADPWRSRAADPEVDLEREILVGAGVGCAVVGPLFLVFVDAYDGPVANGLVGCAFGAFVGGAIAFTSSVRVRPGWDRR
jgi:hypothetical protein